MSSMEVYVYIKEKTELDGNSPILLKDVADVWCNNGDCSQIENLLLGFFMKDKEYQKLSCLEVAKAIKKHLPDSQIHFFGNPEIWIVKKTTKPKRNSIMFYLKLAVISIVLFIGSSMAVMNFHADVDMSTVHKRVYYFITGRETNNPLWVSVPYSLGIGLGIGVFFNHFPGNRRKYDPNPLDLELFNYQNELDQYKKAVRSNKKEKGPS